MKTHSLFCWSLRLNVIVALIGSALTVTASPKTKTTLALPKVPEVAIPQSVFNIPSQPTEGRNPFFPQSTAKVVLPPKVTPGNSVEPSSFVLNGITSPPKPTAMINGRTFGPGEEGEVRLPAGGKMLIKVEEIKSESAVIVVGGVRRELRLRAGA